MPRSARPGRTGSGTTRDRARRGSSASRRSGPAGPDLRQALAPAGRLGSGQNRILEMIATGAPLAATLDALVRLIESVTPGMLGSVLLLAEDGAHLVHGAAPSLPETYTRKIDGGATGPRAGSCGTAAYRGEAVVVEDIDGDPLWADYRDLALAHGLRACWSTPIRDDRKRVLGTFAMYFREPGGPSAYHLQIIELATHTAAIAIARTRDERERGRLLRDLGERVKELTLLQEAARLLQSSRQLDRAPLEDLVALLPPCWQYPEVCEARIVCGGIDVRTPRWRETPWMQAAAFRTGDGRTGSVEVAYLEERPAESEGPFLAEERNLIASLADIVAAFLERSEIQAALAESEAMFRSVFERAALGITLVDMDERIVKCNATFARMLGYAEGEIVGRSFADFTHPQDVAANRDKYRALREGKVDHFEMDKRYVRRDDSVLWVNLTVSFVRLDAHARDGSAPRWTIGMVADVTARKQAEDRVAQLAYREPITGLPNRALLHASLTQAIGEAAARGGQLALLLMNLDRFREINDTLGHHNGDSLLRQIAAKLRAALFDSDLVACLGGDEFAILLTRLAVREDLDRVLAKINGVLQPAIAVAGIPVNVEAKFGVALYPDDGASPDLLWQHADVALAAARERQVAHFYYDASIDHYDPRRLALLGELRDAIERNELVLHYQPKIDLKSEAAMGVEALVRWQHPVHGLIYPDRFIPLAERTDLINPLTRWVLTHALRQCRLWRDSGLALDLSLNLSVRNLHDPKLTGEMVDLVRASGMPLEHLNVEITESAIMADPALAKNVLGELHAAGILFSLDDFGIGQSSLAYLKDLPISRMKIDKSFVMGIADPRNGAIVRSAIELGHNLGLTVTAEGVEDEHALLALRVLGCDYGQGYYFARPMPADRIEAWFRESRWKRHG